MGRDRGEPRRVQADLLARRRLRRVQVAGQEHVQPAVRQGDCKGAATGDQVLQHDVPLPDNPNIGDVHSNTAEETYIEPEGPLWDYFVNRMRPTFRPLIKQIAETYPAEFPNIMAHWSAVTAWESGGR